MSIEVTVNRKDVDGALRLLRRKISREGIFETLQDHRAYAKPGEKIRRKRARAESRRAKLRRYGRKKLVGDER